MSEDAIEGELVPSCTICGSTVSHSHDSAPPAVKPTKRDAHVYQTPALLLTEEKTYVRIRLSDRERKLINMLLKVGVVKKAAEEIGVSYRTAKRYMARPHIRAYLKQMSERQARAADLTVDKVNAVISGAIDGVAGITDRQLAAAQAAAKNLAPRQGPSVVNNTLNYTGVSPFAELDQTAMLEKIRQNLLEMGE